MTVERAPLPLLASGGISRHIEIDRRQDGLRKALFASNRALQLDPSNLLAEVTWHSIYKV